MADRKTTPQQIVEFERSHKYPEEFAPAFDYESDMLAESKREQGYRGMAKRAKGTDREAYTKRADEAHRKMQEQAEYGMAARYDKAHPRRKAAKRD